MIFNFKRFAYSFFFFVRSFSLGNISKMYKKKLSAIVCGEQVTCRTAGLSAFFVCIFLSVIWSFASYVLHISKSTFFFFVLHALRIMSNNISKLSTNLRFYYDYYHFPEFCIGLFNVHLTFNFPKVERISSV